MIGLGDSSRGSRWQGGCYICAVANRFPTSLNLINADFRRTLGDTLVNYENAAANWPRCRSKRAMLYAEAHRAGEEVAAGRCGLANDAILLPPLTVRPQEQEAGPPAIN